MHLPTPRRNDVDPDGHHGPAHRAPDARLPVAGRVRAPHWRTWPVNVGQVYSTLQRLERDGLVESEPERGDDDTDPYRLTDAGRALIGGWWKEPVDRAAPVRDELAIKLALAVTAPGVDVRAVVQGQRKESLRVLRDYTRLQQEAMRAAEPDLAWELVVDHLVFDLEAELRWLDHVSGKVHAAARRRSTGPAATATSPARSEARR